MVTQSNKDILTFWRQLSKSAGESSKFHLNYLFFFAIRLY